MSDPRRPDGPDDPFAEGSGWHEPAHLGGDGDALPDWPAPVGDSPQEPPQRDWWPAGGGAGNVPAHAGGLVGIQPWAVQQGWTVSDGTGPQDAVLADLLAAGPVRLGREARPAGVVRGRAHGLDMVAFDVVYPVGRSLVARYAVTAAPLLGQVPTLRLSPARLWKHRTGGLLHVPSGDPEFDARWMLLVAEDGPRVRRLVQDPTVRGLLLGSDDGDEFWTAAGHVAAIRPDGQLPVLLEHHTRLLAAVVGALSVPW